MNKPWLFTLNAFLLVASSSAFSAALELSATNKTTCQTQFNGNPAGSIAGYTSCRGATAAVIVPGHIDNDTTASITDGASLPHSRSTPVCCPMPAVGRGGASSSNSTWSGISPSISRSPPVSRGHWSSTSLPRDCTPLSTSLSTRAAQQRTAPGDWSTEYWPPMSKCRCRWMAPPTMSTWT